MMKRPRECEEEDEKSHRPQPQTVPAAVTAAKSDNVATKMLQETDPEQFETTHVHQVYDAIAPHFSSTRYKAWPRVRQYVESMPAGSLLCDVGCGNGKNLGLAPHVFSIGCDRSSQLLGIARGHGHEVAQADALTLPYRSNMFDAVISIAVIHHLSTEARRLAALQELVRITAPQGKVLVYVWAVEQAKDRGGSDVLIDWQMTSAFDPTATLHRRYYHLFVKGELEHLCSQLLPCRATGCIATVSNSYYDKENWCVELTKTHPAKQ